MKYFEFGQENAELMVMLHGGGVSYTGALPVAEFMAKHYHVVLVAFDGFNPTEPQTEFKSVEDEARRLGDYIAENYGGHIDILYAVSYGCYVMTRVLGDERITVDTAIGDGMPMVDYPNITSRLGKEIACFFITGIGFLLIGRAGPRRIKFISKLYGKSPEVARTLIYPEATWRSWKNQDYCLFGKKTDHSVFARTDLYIWHGVRAVSTKSSRKTCRLGKTQAAPLRTRSLRA